jgi:hypothetical protein
MLLYSSLRRALLSTTIVLFTLSIQAQNFDDPFGNFTPQDVSLKVCDFDKDADAVIIHDIARSTYNNNYNLVTERRIKFKVLKDQGKDRGNIKIRYYSEDDFEIIHKIDAVVFNPIPPNGGTKTELQQKNIYRKKLNKLISEVSFALPNVQVGSIIEYKYTSTMQHYGGLRDWYFQTDIPVMLSSYRLFIMENVEFAYSVYKSSLLNVDVKPDSRSGSVYFEMRNIAGLRNEPFMTSEKDYLQRVTFQFAGYKDYFGKKKYATTWKDLAKELMDHKMFGHQIEKELSDTREAKALWENTAQPVEKMKQVFEFVRSNFEWTNVYSTYSENGIKEVWSSKRGYSADINLLLLNLLKSAGIEAYPLLVSEREKGAVDTTYPYLDQFTKVVAYVAAEGKNYILDATDKQTPAHLIPVGLLNTKGFVVDKKNPGFISIEDKRGKNLRLVNLRASIDNGGILHAAAAVNSYDYGRIGKADDYKHDKGKYQQNFLSAYTELKVDSFVVKGLEAENIAMQHEFKMDYALTRSGDYLLLNYNLFTGFEKNPFIAENRFSNIDFGTRQGLVFNEIIAVPGLETESIPKNIRLVTPDNSMAFIREIKRVENEIQIGLRVDINKSEYIPAEYHLVKDFYKKMFEAINEPIVFKAKKEL